MIHRITRLYQDNLFRNSFYLMLSTGVMAGFGFLFWLICAHIFNTSEIGTATTLISSVTLIAYIGLLGFNSTFVRILPTSTNRDNEINTGLILSLAAAAIVAAAYVWLLPIFTSSLSIISENIWYGLGFVLIAAMTSANLLTDSIFVAYRAAQYNLVVDGFIQSGIKLLLPFGLIALGAYGIFAASGIAAGVAFAASIFFLVRRFDYKPHLKVDGPTFSSVIHYSFTSYVANFLNMGPTLILPLIVIHHLGSIATGYYYIAFMMANLLYTVIYAVSQSLFAEGSYSDQALHHLLNKSILIISAILIPAGAILYFGSHFILNIYGADYAAEAAGILKILVLAAPAVAFYITTSLLLRIYKKLYGLIAVNAVYIAVISYAALAWADYGLKWVGYAWTLGNVIAGILALILVLQHHNRQRVLINQPLTNIN